MTRWLFSVFLLAIAVAAQSALKQLTAATKLQFGHADLTRWQIYGVAPDGSIWTMEMEPNFPYTSSILKLGGQTKSLPFVCSYSTIQEIYALEDDMKTSRYIIYEKEINNRIDIGGKLVSAPQAIVTSRGYPTIVGLGKDDSYWFGTEGEDEDGKIVWKNLGEQFSSDPAIATRAGYLTYAFHVYGIAKQNGKLLHKSWDGETWAEKWDTLSDGPHKGGITVTSFDALEKGDFHLWTLDSKGALLHKRFDGGKYSDWENLGGKFDKTPIAVHMNADRIDIAGRTSGTGEYVHKAWIDKKWSEKWALFGIDFVSEPVGTTYANQYGYTTYFFGVTKDGKIYAPYVLGGWKAPPEPKDDDGELTYEEVGNVNDPYKEKSSSSSWNELK